MAAAELLLSAEGASFCPLEYDLTVEDSQGVFLPVPSRLIFACQV